MKTLHRRLPDTNPFRIPFFSGGFFIPVVSSHITRVQLFVAAIILCLALSTSAVAQDNRGIFVSSERIALVIGNSAYHIAPLRNPVNDAEDMSTVLSGLGFNVTLKKNVDRRAFEDSIRQFGKQLKHGGVGLFYFAGHGMQVEGRNYLIPINARIESASDIKFEAVDAGFVLGKMEDAENQLNIVILDACRSNPFARDFRSENRGLARMDAPTGSLIVYATAPGEVAADGPKRNGVFTRHLIKHMLTPNLPIEQVLKRVRIDVAAETKQRQIPWESSSLMGDFYFKTEKVVHTSPIIVSENEKPIPKNQQPIFAPEKPTFEIQESKSEYASFPPQVSEPSTVTIKKKLAIFPFYIDIRHTGLWTTPKAVEDDIIRVLIDFFKENKFHIITHSYYDLKKDILSKNIEGEIKNDLWLTNWWSIEAEPNLEIICEIGNKLKVDEVLTYFYFSDANVSFVRGFLIDVKNKKLRRSKNPSAEKGTMFRSNQRIVEFKYIVQQLLN